ncbi:MAG: hypothetical protein ABSG11_14250 [Candidatus Korobacteraceae bacterium]
MPKPLNQEGSSVDPIQSIEVMVAVVLEVTVGWNLLINRFANIYATILSGKIQVCLRYIATKVVVQEECITDGSPADANVSFYLNQQFTIVGLVIDKPKFSINVFAITIDAISIYQSEPAIGRNASFGEGKVRKSGLAMPPYRSQQ